ncbi:GCN5-related N-acetyltransferase [Halanaerobium hydrogeniformans]|uniref:GCN5-related N-acetyltransferase n=1 Tax=Halanaerobium hydrogeniformans TaxID=656519 RepID=E4RIQ2_HALHG|nr:GNAT family N-acetyltransferase [Halanaerobium hydrogeniformans]ADQ15122.1 GCN5-related N-acetyltransferase [Halanaerobium hydrogeniformans]
MLVEFSSKIEYTCRLASQKDAEGINELMKKAFADYGKTKNKNQKVVNSALKESLEDISEDIEKNIVLIMLDNDKIIASLRLEEVVEHRYLLKRFAVAPDYQNHGLGSKLFKKALEKLNEKNAQFVQLYSSLENKKLINFYQGLGFNCVATDHKKGYERGLWVKKL